MGNVKQIPPVKYFVGMIAKQEDFFENGMTDIRKKFGELDLVSDTIPFDFTDYYEPEMGRDLLRKFVSIKELMPPEILPDVKLFTNEIEIQLGNFKEDKLYRHLNMDPGYLTLAKVILATTKNQHHRIYLRDGIFAEITLHWSKKSFRHREWTYPDYRSESYLNYFTRLREIYFAQLHELGIKY